MLCIVCARIHFDDGQEIFFCELLTGMLFPVRNNPNDASDSAVDGTKGIEVMNIGIYEFLETFFV